jgi:hypothetical protein
LYGVTNPATFGRALVVVGHNSLDQMMKCPARDRGSRSARHRIVPGDFGPVDSRCGDRNCGVIAFCGRGDSSRG